MRPRWLALLAGILYFTGLVVGTWRGNGLIYAAGGLAAVGVLAPLWWRRPRYLLVALVLYLPFEDAIVGTFARNGTAVRVLPDGLLLLAIVGRATLALRRRERFFGTSLDLPVAFLLGVAVVSTLINRIPPTQAIQGPYTMFRYATVFYLAVSSRFDERETRFFVRSLVWVAIVESVIAVTQFLISGPRDPLPHGTMASPNTLGIYLGIVCTLALAAYWNERTALPQRELWLVLGLSVAATVLSLSRQGSAALALGVVIVGWFIHNRDSTTKLATRLWPAGASGAAGAVVSYLAVKVGAAGLLWPAWASVHAFIVPGGSVGATGPAGLAYGQQIAYKTGANRWLSADFYNNSRLYTIVNAGPSILRRSPLFGLGPGTFGAQATFHNRAFYDSLHVGLLLSNPSSIFVADVQWITILGQLGLLGIAGFLWLLYAIGRTGYRVWARSQEPFTQAVGMTCLALVPIFLVVAWFGPNLEVRQISILLWFLPGLALSLWRSEQAMSHAVELASGQPTDVPVLRGTVPEAPIQ